MKKVLTITLEFDTEDYESFSEETMRDLYMDVERGLDKYGLAISDSEWTEKED